MDNYWERKEEQKFVSSYKGIYQGNYSGDETGTLTIDVSSKGDVTLSRTSAFSAETFSAGMVREDGALQSVSLPSRFTLLGNLSAKSGSWKLDKWQGNWTVIKQQ